MIYGDWNWAKYNAYQTNGWMVIALYLDFGSCCNSIKGREGAEVVKNINYYRIYDNCALSTIKILIYFFRAVVY